MLIANLSIQEIEELLSATVEADILEAVRNDRRAVVKRLLSRYEKREAEKERIKNLYQYEYEAQAEGFHYIAGVDEAGRGPLAGPVVVAAVILPVGLFLPRLNDSKKISPKVRDELFEMIKENAVAYHIATVSEKIIDRDNIYQATVSGMYEAIFALKPPPDKVLIDAVPLDKLPMPSLSIVKGDAKSASIAAASILAKVTRDRLMTEFDKEYPAYGFAQHKGYGTAMHLAALKKYGATPIHRRSFRPVPDYVRDE